MKSGQTYNSRIVTDFVCEICYNTTTTTTVALNVTSGKKISFELLSSRVSQTVTALQGGLHLSKFGISLLLALGLVVFLEKLLG